MTLPIKLSLILTYDFFWNIPGAVSPHLSTFRYCLVYKLIEYRQYTQRHLSGGNGGGTFSTFYLSGPKIKPLINVPATSLLLQKLYHHCSENQYLIHRIWDLSFSHLLSITELNAVYLSLIQTHKCTPNKYRYTLEFSK